MRPVLELRPAGLCLVGYRMSGSQSGIEFKGLPTSVCTNSGLGCSGTASPDHRIEP